MPKRPTLSKPQQVALRRLGGEWVRGEPMTSTTTFRGLQRRGLVVYDFRSGTGGWHLTDDGTQELSALNASTSAAPTTN